ncbi:unnamed protein product, partial [Ectocarpus sp. 12 AP-2014]
LLRAERLIAARRMSILQRQVVLFVIAGLFVAVALVMGNIAAYQWLLTMMATYWAATCVALGNFVIAAVLAFVAGRMPHEHALTSATEMRDLAIEEVEHEVDALVEEVRGTAHEVRVFVRDPFGAILPAALMPLLTTLLSLLGGNKGQTDAPAPHAHPTGPASRPGDGFPTAEPPRAPEV